MFQEFTSLKILPVTAFSIKLLSTITHSLDMFKPWLWSWKGNLLLRLYMNSLFQEVVISNEDLRLTHATHPLSEDKKTEHTAKCIPHWPLHLLLQGNLSNGSESFTFNFPFLYTSFIILEGIWASRKTFHLRILSVSFVFHCYVECCSANCLKNYLIKLVLCDSVNTGTCLSLIPLFVCT